MAHSLRVAAVWTAVLFLNTHCTSPPTTQPSPQADDSNLIIEIARELQAPSVRQQALRFHQYVQGELSTQAQTLLVEGCRGPTTNPFCHSIGLKHRWAVYRRKRTLPPVAKPAQVITPTPLTIQRGKIVNWSPVRRADKQSLIKSFETLPLDLVRQIGRRALAENRCPNMASIAVAATLEDHFPNPSLALEASALYEKASKCLRSTPIDHENFLVRAALLNIWHKKYSQAIRLLRQVNPTDAFAGRALYWLYRVYDETGAKQKAQAIYNRLRGRYPFSFHAIVAAAENGEDPLKIVVSHKPIKKVTRSKTSSLLNKVLNQIETLNSFGFQPSAAVLVDWMLATQRRMPPGLSLYLAELGDYKIKVSTLPALFIRNRRYVSINTLEMAFPKAHHLFFEKHAGNTDPLLLLALSCKESKFDSLAQSSANARGIMQIAPETGKRLAGHDTPDLFDPETNIHLGARYVHELLERWNDRGFLVLANYNAGEDAIRNWLSRFTTQDPLLFIDLIPYRETRDYIGFVLSNYYWYRRLYSPDPVVKVLAPEIARR